MFIWVLAVVIDCEYAFLFEFMGGWYGKYSPREAVYFMAA